MKRNLIVFVLSLAFVQFTFAQTTWSADPAHSNTRFSVKHLGIAFVDGEFTNLSGFVETDNDNSFKGAKFDFTIEASSINTRVEARDEHLRSDDFFNVEAFPYITLKNASLKHVKENQYTLEGDLNIRDVTKKVVFDVVQNNGIITDPWGKQRAGFTAKTKINRKDFNINFGGSLPSGVDVVANDVNIEVNLEVVKLEEE